MFGSRLGHGDLPVVPRRCAGGSAPHEGMCPPSRGCHCAGAGPAWHHPLWTTRRDGGPIRSRRTRDSAMKRQLRGARAATRSPDVIHGGWCVGYAARRTVAALRSIRGDHCVRRPAVRRDRHRYGGRRRHVRPPHRSVRQANPVTRTRGLPAARARQLGLHRCVRRGQVPGAGVLARPARPLVGGGFAGLFASSERWHRPVEVTVVDRAAHHLFQPLRYECATGVLSEAQIA
jgi:hypothetical protein